MFIAGLWQSLRRPLILVTPHDKNVSSLASDIEYFHRALNSSAQVCAFPELEIDPFSGLMPHAGILQTRATTLWCLRQKRADIVVTSVRAASTRLTAPSTFDTYSLHVSKGDDVSQELFVEHLAVAGYLRQEPVSGPGEFSVRGGIVDVFSPLMRSPVRMEFFGDTVDSIREFDLDDQRSRGPIQHIDILPMQDVLATKEMIRAWGERAAQHWTEDVFQKDLAEKRLFAEGGELFPGATFLLPLAFPLESTIFDYAEGAVLILDESEILREIHEKFQENLSIALSKRFRTGALPCLRRICFGRPKNSAAPGFGIPGCILKSWGPQSFRTPWSFPCVHSRARAGTEGSRSWRRRFEGVFRTEFRWCFSAAHWAWPSAFAISCMNTRFLFGSTSESNR